MTVAETPVEVVRHAVMLTAVRVAKAPTSPTGVEALQRPNFAAPTLIRWGLANSNLDDIGLWTLSTLESVWEVGGIE